jgi:hypothetical protein
MDGCQGTLGGGREIEFFTDDIQAVAEFCGEKLLMEKGKLLLKNFIQLKKLLRVLLLVNQLINHFKPELKLLTL